MSVPTNPGLDELRERLDGLVRYRREHLTGDEKGEAAIFLENLFRALGHDGVRQAGATLEKRIKKRDNGGTAYADLEWKPRRQRILESLWDAYQRALAMPDGRQLSVAVKCLELLMRHRGMFNDRSQVEHSGTVVYTLDLGADLEEPGEPRGPHGNSVTMHP